MIQQSLPALFKRMINLRIADVWWPVDLAFLTVFLAGFVAVNNYLLNTKFSFQGDSVLWYGMFHYFVEALRAGDWAFWNPYVHGGEPFYYAWNIVRLCDPINFIVILFTWFSSPDLYQLYNITLVAKMGCASLGVYFVLRVLLVRVVSLFVTGVLVFWGPLGGGILGHIAYLDAFAWFPWILFCILKVFELDAQAVSANRHRRNWLLLCAWFIGISMGAGIYHWVYGLYLLIIFLVIAAFTHREPFKAVFQKNWRSILVGFGIIAIMGSPLIALLLERDAIYPILRDLYRDELANKSTMILGIDYESIATRDPQVGLGSFAQIKEMIPFLSFEYAGWQLPKLAGILGLIGILFGVSQYKKHLLILFGLSAFLYIGPTFPFEWLYRILYFASPLLWLTRHMAIFAPFVVMIAIIFVGFGLDYAIQFLNRGKYWPDWRLPLWVRQRLVGTGLQDYPQITALILLGLVLAVFAGVNFSHTGLAKSNPAFISYTWLIVLMMLLGTVAFGYFLLSSVSWRRTIYATCFLMPVTLLLIYEQVFVAAAAHSWAPDCRRPVVCNTNHYFEDFTFPTKSVETLPTSDQRILGLNLKKAYLLYMPTINKERVALEDIAPPVAPPVGSGTSMASHFPHMTFQSGLYHVWLKEYLRIYSIGEWQPEAFTRLMGVDRSVFEYRTNYVWSDPEKTDSLLKKVDGRATAALIERAVIFEDKAEIPVGENAAPSLASLMKPYIVPEVPTKVLETIAVNTFTSEESSLDPRWILHHSKGNEGLMFGTSQITDEKRPSVTIKSAGNARSLLRFKMTDIDAYKGQYIRAQVKLRGDSSKILGDIAFDAQSHVGQGPSDIALYHKVGDWQTLSVVLKLSDDADYGLFTILVDSKVQADVEVADFKVDLIEVPEETEAYVLYDFTEYLPAQIDQTFAAEVTSFSPNRLVLNVRTSKDGVFVYRDIISDDWSVTVDGVQRPLLKADLVFKGVALSPGQHEVVFEYNPTLFKFTLYLYLIMLVVGGVGVVIWATRHRRMDALESR